MRKKRHIGFVLSFLSVLPAAVAQGSYDQALGLYNKTDYAAVIGQLKSSATDAKSLALLGQAYLMSDEFHRASETLERAVALDPGNSTIQDWLGRAYGRRAEVAFPVSAISLATKARDAFEKAVRLNPANTDAVNDLFEFYLQAPAMLGGGMDKARSLLPLIGKTDRAEIHFAFARMSEEQKDFARAEAEYRRAAERAPAEAGRMIDLAKFLAKHGRVEESDRAFETAEKIRPNAPQLMYARAESWIHAKRNLDQARDLLRRYIASSDLTPDDPSRADATKLLKKASDN
jgi:Flp pilus assembly protein TadD